MVELLFHFSADLLNFKNIVDIHGEEYNLAKNASNLVVKLPDEANNFVELEIASCPRHELQMPSNFIKKIIAVIVMIFITTWSTDIYDYDCKEYRVKFKLSFQNAEGAKLFVRMNSQIGELSVESVTDTCKIVKQQKNSVVSKEYTNAIFSEYQRFNCWRAGIFFVGFLCLLIIGIVTKTYTTVIFSSIILLFIAITFFYTRKRLEGLRKRIISGQ